MPKHFMLLCFLIFITACTTTPKNVNNICDIFNEKNHWYDEITNASDKWGTPIHIIMAIIYQESRFIADAQPPRPWLLGIIPWFRSSSAYGYAQAQDAAWQDYLAHPKSHWWADRDDFSDACDFIGWYCSISHQKLGISLWDTEKLYLSYHEGHGGYSRKTFLNKPWLIRTAKKVDKKSRQFRLQFSSCENEFESTSWFFW
jgi:hypothetical protein